MKKYDLIIIGSGGGSKLTRPAANLGLKVAIIEKAELGGTCLNHGCIPSKMLIHPADVAKIISEASRFELDVTGPTKVRFAELVTRVNQTIDAESASIAPLYEEHPNIDFYPHEARFVAEKVLEVNGEQLTGDRIFLPVGARPSIPKLPGLEGTPYWTYNEALRETKQPKDLLIIGGGYIATELGHYFASLGTDVRFLVRSRLLRREDETVSEEFTRIFSDLHDVHCGVKIQSVKYENDRFHVEYLDSDGKTLCHDTEKLLVVTGVKPNTDRLALENTGIETTKEGYFVVDDRLQTTVPGVYAFGDAIGRYLYRHTVNYEGEYLFRTLYEAPCDEAIHYPPIPSAVFSNPQVGSVGAKEQELKEAGVDYIVGLNKYAHSAMGMALRSEEGFVKLLFDRNTRKLLGAHILGEEASNMVHMLIAYMKLGGTLDDMLDTIFIHPALPEIVRNAARKAKAAFEAESVQSAG